MIGNLFLTAVLIQAFQPSFTFEDSLAGQPEGMSFWSGYARRDAGDWVVEIYTRRFQGKGQYVLRRSLNTPDGREQGTWTTSTECPVVFGVIQSLERLAVGGPAPLPPLEAPLQPHFSYPDRIPIQPDSPSYAIWGHGRQPDGAMSTYRVTAGSGLVAGFVERAETALRSCWRQSL